MAESWDNGLKIPLNGSTYKNLEFGPLFGCYNFQNQIDTWETTVGGAKKVVSWRFEVTTDVILFQVGFRLRIESLIRDSNPCKTNLSLA